MTDHRIKYVVFLATIVASSMPLISFAQVRAGLTFGLDPVVSEAEGNTVLLSCGQSSMDVNRICDPYKGDRLCKETHPLLCFLDIDMPAPAYLKSDQYWSGGLVAITDKVQGDEFSKIGDANRYCAKNFGKGWRVASFHDGGGWAIRAYGNIGDNISRVWIDIKNQAEGTCWAR